MRLRTFESFWLLKNGLLYTYPSPQKNISTDVIVLGGGITGALISHAVLKLGYKTLLLDKGDIALGSTSATTSMLQYEIDEPLYKLAKKIGEAEAAKCYRAGIDAINDLDVLIKQEKIDCGFQRQKSLYLAHNAKASTWLYKEFEIRNKYKLGVKWLTAGEIKDTYGLVSFGGILSNTAASMDAYECAHELIRNNVKKGLQVYDQVEIKKVNHLPRSIQLKLQNGKSIHAKKIIYCTGFESVQMIDDHIADLHSTFACVSEVGIKINSNLNKILVWDTKDPYLYMRTTDDGRLLVGGVDSPHKSAQFMETSKEKKSKKLIRQLKQLSPTTNFVEDINWAGVFGSTKDGLPYIGAHPSFANAYFVLGFGGNGITFSVQGMDIITQLLKRQDSEISYYYRFGR